ncbi:MAG TPA: DUF72 domain-containing protein [Gemmatimonadales bacterium]|jgi:uncharacterized protein YecE (DUF72 family)|nr:DUF72 domain-containing protein [Gemmatimonadales bacterium]
MRLHVGTSGFAYKEWKGGFYPENIAGDAMLPAYAARLSTVEINNTFYRMPKESVLTGWAAQVPAGFRFVLKASQRITHFARLADDDGALDYFLRIASVLGSQLGPTLFQLPPNLKKDVPRLDAFLARLPHRWRAAFEFRHPSWFDEEVYAALRSRDAALVYAEDDESATPLEPTTSWGYLRLRRLAYTPDELTARAERIRAQPWEEAFVFFKHEEGAPALPGTGPLAAEGFAALGS